MFPVLPLLSGPVFPVTPIGPVGPVAPVSPEIFETVFTGILLLPYIKFGIL